MKTMTKRKPRSKRADNPWPERLKATRAYLGNINQVETAKLLGLSPRMYVYFESGVRIPQRALAVLLDQFCNFPDNFKK